MPDTETENHLWYPEDPYNVPGILRTHQRLHSLKTTNLEGRLEKYCWLPLPDGYLSRQEPTLLVMGQFLSANSQVIKEFWINTHAAIMGSKKSHDLLPQESGKLVVSFDPSLKAGELGKLIAEFPGWVQKPKKQEQQYLRVGEDEYLSWSKESEFTLPLPFCSVQGLSGLGDWCLPALAKVIFFTPFTDSNANLFQRYPHHHPLKQCLPAIWASLSPVKLTHKVYHQTLCSKFLLTWKFLDIIVILGVPRPSYSSL